MGLAAVLAIIWGAFWALFLQVSPIGRFLALRRTWITVVVGVGVDLLIARLVLRWREWLRLVGVIIMSSLPIITRSLWNEWGDHQEIMHGVAYQRKNTQ